MQTTGMRSFRCRIRLQIGDNGRRQLNMGYTDSTYQPLWQLIFGIRLHHHVNYVSNKYPAEARTGMKTEKLLEN